MTRARLPIFVLAVVATITLGTVSGAFAAQYPPKASTCATAPSAGQGGAHVVVKGTNWATNSSVQIQFLQNGSSSGLGSATTDDKGKFKTQAQVPNSATRGKAAVEVTGLGASGQTLECFTNFQVIDPGKPAAAVTPQRGIAVTPGILLVALGFVLGFVVLRRRWTRRYRFLDAQP
jgi:hypothetical protein